MSGIPQLPGLWLSVTISVLLLLTLRPPQKVWGRVVLWAIVAELGLALLLRGLSIAFVPLTSPFESFLFLSVICLSTAAYKWPTLLNPAKRVMLIVTTGFLVGALFFGRELHFPSPMLNTVWYAVHVPLSFLAYAFWFLAAGYGCDYLSGGTDEKRFTEQAVRALRSGFIVFSLAMILGGIWGLLSWGAWFLWDAKILWSLALWVYGSILLHLFVSRFSSPFVRAIALILLIPLLLMTFVGTSFFSGSIHRF